MHSPHNHIVLIGFKHVGKSVIGIQLAKTLHMPFVDLDKEIELIFKTNYKKNYTTHQIMKKKGVDFFRHLETDALFKLISSISHPSVISLGGGTPLSAENQRLIKSCLLVHINAPPGIIFERILMSGRPAFFNPNEDMVESFERLWNEREKIYKKIEDFAIENDGSIADAVEEIVTKLNLTEKSK